MNKMKAMRFIMGYSQSEIARLLGITQATYNRIENEVNRTSDEMFGRIAEILGLSKDELYDQADERQRHLPRLFSNPQKRRLERTPLVKAYKQETEQKERVDPCNIPTIIKELKDLADAGVITEAEFQEKKSGLLARL
jgi:transcriptional regulator with XRE-family HTH domain